MSFGHSRGDEQLHTALQRPIVIEQAKGILAARRDITPNQAFEDLRHHARHHQMLLSKAADAVIDTGFTPNTGPTRRTPSPADIA
ncbi:ANTAR domain-containing protein [Streptomyces sp. NPDC059759]|uniref:ANTAR domain-containing protein n=1 Tax=unclassified Streptomyces TaxID=2593676 RepID=UPI003652566F